MYEGNESNKRKKKKEIETEAGVGPSEDIIKSSWLLRLTGLSLQGRIL